MDKNELSNYVNQRLSIRAISDKSGKSFSTIRYWLNKHGLKTTYNETHCKECGETNSAQFYDYRKALCKTCDNRRVLIKSLETRQRAIALLGGKCLSCGFSKSRFALDIHHIDPSRKDPNFKSMRLWSWDRVERELRHCVLLCKNCHTMVHAGEIEGFLQVT